MTLEQALFVSKIKRAELLADPESALFFIAFIEPEGGITVTDFRGGMLSKKDETWAKKQPDWRPVHT